MMSLSVESSCSDCVSESWSLSYACTCPCPSDSTSTPYSFPFCSTVDEDLVCVICTNVVREAEFTKCGHVFCTGCLDPLYLQPVAKQICPLDRSLLNPSSQRQQNNFVNRRVWQLKVKCPFSNASYALYSSYSSPAASSSSSSSSLSSSSSSSPSSLSVPLHLPSPCLPFTIGDNDRNLISHFKTCPFFVVECDACKVKIQRYLVTEHVKSECEMRKVECSVCRDKISYKEITSHQTGALNCANMLQCPHACDSSLFFDVRLASQLSSHRAVCPLETMTCTVPACDDKFQRRLLQQHLTDNAQKHVVTLIAQNEKIQQELKETRQELHSTKQELSDTKQEHNIRLERIEELLNIARNEGSTHSTSRVSSSSSSSSSISSSSVRSNIKTRDVNNNVIVGSFVDQFPSEFSPFGIAVDDENLYFSNCENDEINVVNKSSRLVTRTFTIPNVRGIAVSARFLYAACKYKVVVHDVLSSSSVLEFGQEGSGVGQFQCAYAIAVDKENVYVSDYYLHRVQVFSLTGAFIRSIGRRGTGAGQLICPSGVAVDNDKDGLSQTQSQGDRLYVADIDNNRIQVFNKATGAFLLQWGRLGWARDHGCFNRPFGLVVDQWHAYVTDSKNNRVQIFDKTTGAFVRTFGERGVGQGQFNLPTGIAVHVKEDGNASALIISDRDNKRIQLFT